VDWQAWKLRSVLHRLDTRQRIDAPRGEGAWEQLDRLLRRNQGEMRARHRRMLDILRAYRAAAMALPDAVVVVDRNSQRILWFNAASTRLLLGRRRTPQPSGRPVVQSIGA